MTLISGDAQPETTSQEPITETTAPETTPQGEVAPEVVEGKPTEKPESGSKESDGFTRIDPKTLPPELQSIYKSMQADYTRKTQEVADLRKSHDGMRQILSDPDVQRLIYAKAYGLEMPKQEQQSAEAKKQEPDVSTMTDEELFDKAVRAVAKEELETYKAEMGPRQQFIYAQMMSSSAANAVTEMDQWTKQNNYPDFATFRPAIAQQFRTPQDPTGDKAIEQLILTGQLVPALKMIYTNLAFPQMVQVSKTQAREEVTAKKSANLPGNTVSAAHVKEREGINPKQSLGDMIRQSLEFAKKEHGVT